MTMWGWASKLKGVADSGSGTLGFLKGAGAAIVYGYNANITSDSNEGVWVLSTF